VYHAYVFVLRGGKIYPNKEGRVYKFQHESLTEVVCQTQYYPGKNHANMFSNALVLLANMFSNALVLLETLLLRDMSLQ